MTHHSILVVEDESLVRDMLKDVLTAEGYEVLTADDGQQAERIMQNRPVDAVVTDLIMPEQDGLQLLMYARREHPDTPVVVITAPSNNVYLPAAKRLGASFCFEKPLQLGELKAAIQGLLEDPLPS